MLKYQCIIYNASFATLSPSLFHPACPRVVGCGLGHMVEGRVEAIRNRTDWTINNGMAFVRERHVHCKLSSEGAHSVDESPYDAHEVAYLGGS